MSAPIPFTPPRPATPAPTSALDRLTATYALVHDEHASPLVGCYLCLHGEPRRPHVIARAA